jgi:sec-independent protein translocase protein TatB
MGWTEMFVVGVVALIVVGPKDLPGMFRELGRFVARMKGMAREFQTAMEDAADQSGASDITKTLRNVTNPKSMGLGALNKATGGMPNWDDDIPSSSSAKGPETQKLSQERADVAKKIREASAERAQARLDRDAAKPAIAAPPAPPETAAPAEPLAEPPAVPSATETKS